MTGVDRQAPLPIPNLDPVTAAVLRASTRAAARLPELMRRPHRRAIGTLASIRLKTEIGTLAVSWNADETFTVAARFSDRLAWNGHELVVFDTADMPDTLLAACHGRRLDEVVDLTPGFPFPEARVTNIRRVVSSVRLRTDLPATATIALADLQPPSPKKRARAA